MPNPELPWRYFVSYAHGSGFGSIHIESELPATDYEAVQEFRNTISRTGGRPVHEIVVINFILLSGPGYATSNTRPNSSGGIR